MRTDSKSLTELLEPVFHVLSETGGKFLLEDNDGNEFIIVAREVFDEREVVLPQEQQLSLPQAASVARAIRKHVDSSIEDDVIDRVNRDIALAYASEQSEEVEADEVDDLAISEEDSSSQEPIAFDTPLAASSLRIRFEPLKGDLHPDLQD